MLVLVLVVLAVLVLVLVVLVLVVLVLLAEQDLYRISSITCASTACRRPAV